MGACGHGLPWRRVMALSLMFGATSCDQSFRQDPESNRNAVTVSEKLDYLQEEEGVTSPAPLSIEATERVDPATLLPNRFERRLGIMRHDDALIVRGTVNSLVAFNGQFPDGLFTEASVGTRVSFAASEVYCGSAVETFDFTYLAGSTGDQSSYTSLMPRDLAAGREYVVVLHRTSGEYFLEDGLSDVHVSISPDTVLVTGVGPISESRIRELCS